MFSAPQSHENQCPKIIAQCSHCAEEFTRSTITTHESICDSAIIPCAASDVGCPWSGPRRELPDHVSVCAFRLLRPVLQAHSNRLATLELENKALRKKIDILLPPRPSNDAPPSTVFDDQTIQLLTEQEHLRSDVGRLSASLGEMEIKQSMLLMNETLRTKEEMASIRAAINGIRMQIHWLLTTRLQSPEQRSGGSASGSQATGRSVEGGSVLPVRRLAGEHLGFLGCFLMRIRLTSIEQIRRVIVLSFDQGLIRGLGFLLLTLILGWFTSGLLVGLPSAFGNMVWRFLLVLFFSFMVSFSDAFAPAAFRFVQSQCLL